jgi:ATP/maltotriose-dependent transcriptional regulator MalT
MAPPDLNTILQELQALNQASQAGRLTPDKLKGEVMRVTGKLQRALATLNTQLPPGASAETNYMMELFQSQIRTVLEASGIAPRAEELVEPEAEEAEQLTEDLKQRKRGGNIRT